MHVKCVIVWSSIRGTEVENNVSERSGDQPRCSEGKPGQSGSGDQPMCSGGKPRRSGVKREYMPFKLLGGLLKELEVGLTGACKTFHNGGKGDRAAEMLCLNARNVSRQGNICWLPCMHMSYILLILSIARGLQDFR